MHPELLGALARQRSRELVPQNEFRHTEHHDNRVSIDRLRPQRVLQRARWRVGSVLLDVGIHLMAAT